MKKVKFAIIGPGTIAHSFMNGINELDNAEVIAIVSRSKERAESFASKYNLKYAYDDYEECLNNKEVDAIYVATPPFMHFPNTKLALEKGKHVICEKPFTVDVDELKQLIKIAKEKGLLLMEAMKSPFIPVNIAVKKLIDQGEIGDIITLEGSFTYNGGPRYDHFHFIKGNGGGALYDVGVYPLFISLFFIDSEVKDYCGYAKKAPTGADSLASVILQFENGVIANIRGGIEVNTYQGVYIYGTKGKIFIPEFWVASKAFIDYYDGRETKIITGDASNEFKYQVGHFVDLINKGLKESDVMTHQISLKVMEIMYSLVNKWNNEV
ncbi:TPA: Gfo/Idh/MocA family oxidoreductase [bacterium]|jgi:predicted dehydrogenase|nr:Gfo/Idh/MocA family oxidoreductase [bacterium]